MSEVEDIKARLDIVDIISEYVQLKKAGVNYRALCPFHAEKTPSFFVSRERQTWHCFGCSEGGDVISFAMKMENMDFLEALKMLADKAGVALTPQNPKETSQKNRVLRILDLAEKFWNTILLESSKAKHVREYLARRNVNDESIETFGLGYAPDSWDATLKFLEEKRFSENEIFLSGLSVKKDRGAGFYDRFRARLMFPVKDMHGNTVGFGGRTLGDEKAAKYVNTPQTLVYNKSRILYNLSNAKYEIKKANEAILVEGYMDVIASWQAGVKNVVAVSGTALTDEHVQAIGRFTKNVSIAFDSDDAGEMASRRGIEKILESDLNLKVITIPGGKDPDDCIQKDPNEWKKAVGEARNYMEYLFSLATKKYSPSSLEGKKSLAQALLPTIAKIENVIDRTHWIQRLSSLIHVPEDILLGSVVRKNPVRMQTGRVAAPEKTRRRKKQDELQAESLLSLGLKYPENIPYIIDTCRPEHMPTGELNALYKNLIIYYTRIKSQDDGESFHIENFLAYLRSQGDGSGAESQIKKTNELILLAEKDFFDFESPQIASEVQNLAAFLRKNFLRKRIEKLQYDIENAERAGDKENLQKLLGEYSRMIEEEGLQGIL